MQVSCSHRFQRPPDSTPVCMLPGASRPLCQASSTSLLRDSQCRAPIAARSSGLVASRASVGCRSGCGCHFVELLQDDRVALPLVPGQLGGDGAQARRQRVDQPDIELMFRLGAPVNFGDRAGVEQRPPDLLGIQLLMDQEGGVDVLFDRVGACKPRDGEPLFGDMLVGEEPFEIRNDGVSDLLGAVLRRPGPGPVAKALQAELKETDTDLSAAIAESALSSS